MAVTHFSAVPNRSLGPAPRFEESPFGSENKGVGLVVPEHGQRANNCGFRSLHMPKQSWTSRPSK